MISPLKCCSLTSLLRFWTSHRLEDMLPTGKMGNCGLDTTYKQVIAIIEGSAELTKYLKLV